MNVKSLGLKSDLIFHRFGGEIIDRGAYTVIHTPKNHGYFWGNFLLFAETPRVGDADRWCEIFAKELGQYPEITHQAFTWDVNGDTAALAEFEQLGFDIESTMVMTGRHFSLPRERNREVTVRKVESRDQWRDVLELQIATTQGDFEPGFYREFMKRKFLQYQEMARMGIGQWFGAYTGTTLVADLGIYFDDRIGRFQNVETHEDFRRRGICRTLVYEVSQWAIKERPQVTLVIEADTKEIAGQIYASMGYQESERLTSVCRYNGKS